MGGLGVGCAVCDASCSFSYIAFVAVLGEMADFCVWSVALLFVRSILFNTSESPYSFAIAFTLLNLDIYVWPKRVYSARTARRD